MCALARKPDRLTDPMIDELLADSARVPGTEPDPLELFIAELRSVAEGPPVPARADLAEIFVTGRPVPGRPGGANDRPDSQPSRRRRMFTTLGAFLTTLTGKIVLGATAVAVGVGSAHAAGVVDVPGLPDSVPAVEHVPDDVPANDGSAGSDAPGRAGRGDDGPAGREVRPETDPEGRQPGDPGKNGDPGVDGDDVSDRASDGEPQEDGREFGQDIAEDATDDTPAEDHIGGPDDPGDDQRPEDVPAGRPDSDGQPPVDLPEEEFRVPEEATGAATGAEG